MDKEYKTSKEEFDAWLKTCPVDYEFSTEIDNEIEKRYEKFYEWLDTCPFKWTESGHPTSGMTSVNFEIKEE